MRQNRMRLFRLLALMVLLSGFGALDAQRKEYHYAVRGRVVDHQGKPIRGAVVYLDPMKGVDQAFGYTTDESGTFRLEETTNIARKRRILYVAAPLPKQAISLIFPPYNLLPRLTGRQFAGKRLVMRRAEVNLGDVRVQVRYGAVKVRLIGCANNPLLTTSEPWRFLWFRVRDQSNKSVTESTLSQDDIARAVDLAESAVVLALPEGLWRVEVSPSGSDGTWIRSDSALLVKTGAEQTLTFRLCNDK